jgi:putative toxin-antitoxin system antitoxin component (TIGR02293 family)
MRYYTGQQPQLSGKIVADHIFPHQGRVRETSGSLLQEIRKGLVFDELEALREALDLPLDRIAPKIGLSLATLHRRKTSGRLTTDESDRVIRYARLIGQSVEIFGDLESARAWLAHPQRGLNQATPLDYAETEVGAREVEALLGRIEYGVYS